MKVVRLITCIFSIFLSYQCVSKTHDIDSYINIVKSGDSTEKIELYKNLYEYSGVSDEKLFELIAAYLKNNTVNETNFDLEIVEYNWAVKALASSGNKKYEDLLLELWRTSELKKTRTHAKLARERLSEFAKWNPVISSKEYENNARTEDQALWMRMLSSGDMEMAIFALKKAYSALSFDDREFVAKVKNLLQEKYPVKTKDGYSLEFQSWACRYLASDIHASEHMGLIREVSNKSPNKKVKKWAGKVLK